MSRSTACGSRPRTSMPSARSSRSRRRSRTRARDPHRPRHHGDPRRRRRGGGERVGPRDAAAGRERDRADAALRRGSPALWSVDAPNLYTARDDRDRRRRPMLDEERTRFGIRTLQLDPQHGLRINGRDGEPARRVHPPRQRAARVGGDRARRGAPRRAAQGGGLQRHPQRAQPDQQGDARRVRPRRDARHGRDVRHVDRGEERRSTTRSRSRSGGSATSRRWSRRTSTTRA